MDGSNTGEGTCPKCGEHLTYDGAGELNDGGASYPVKCKACGFEGKEWYDVLFSQHTDKNGEEC